MMRCAVMVLVSAVAAADPAMAANLRDLCTDRPGVTTQACTVDAGHLQLEVGVVDWTRDRQVETLTDTILTGDMVARYGVGDSTELRLGWTAYGHERERDRIGGALQRSGGVGDVTLGFKQNLISPDGSGFSAAVLPMVSLPVGGATIGDGTWSASLQVPITYDLTDAVELEFTSELDAAADEDRHGRHLAWGAAVGIDFQLTQRLDLDVDLQAMRDSDPEDHATFALAAASLAYKVGDDMQFDVGGTAGLNRVTPDVEVYFGITRRF